MDDDTELVLAAPDFGAELAFWTGRGWRLEAIWPADDPQVARLGGSPRLRLERAAQGSATLRMAGGAPATSPAGHRIETGPAVPAYALPEVQTGFGLRRLADGDPWMIGRAGMHYRDLVPDRLGGAIIASHIRIPDGGPVPDMVHYHTIGFQLIWCYRGWVDLVYEDQGPPFRLTAGSCVIQPPEIRHRVLHASDGIEVVEIGVPAVHVTTIDHAMELPNGPAVPGRRFQGQRFVHHRAEGAPWAPATPGFAARETGIAEATGGVAGVRLLRTEGAEARFTPEAEIHFAFVLEGALTLEAGGGRHRVGPADAFVLPPGEEVAMTGIDPGTELLEVTLPGR
ncbi:AraC family ligand binding domain-containing protein [Jannaschia formosa]|uniref:AraC family ligand binding domain-containing protein n=1 Tax=Jannaschia formosa TaxID=2259592 RepID=UPI000E1B7DE8|nr:AraC family ligand binding domain-containing protein [Jannaschia formosa]TFL16895.1 cupin [Jannaschia formosa]